MGECYEGVLSVVLAVKLGRWKGRKIQMDWRMQFVKISINISLNLTCRAHRMPVRILREPCCSLLMRPEMHPSSGGGGDPLETHAGDAFSPSRHSTKALKHWLVRLLLHHATTELASRGQPRPANMQSATPTRSRLNHLGVMAPAVVFIANMIMQL